MGQPDARVHGELHREVLKRPRAGSSTGDNARTPLAFGARLKPAPNASGVPALLETVRVHRVALRDWRSPFGDERGLVLAPVPGQLVPRDHWRAVVDQVQVLVAEHPLEHARDIE